MNYQNDENRVKKAISERSKHKSKKTIGIIIFAVILLVSIAYFVFMLGFYGFSVNSESVKIETEFQYCEGVYLDQAYVIHLRSTNGTPLNVEVNRIYDEADRLTGYEIIPRALSANIGENPDNFTIGYSPSDSGITEPVDGFDFIVTIKFKDKDIHLSMVEEGVFEIQETVEHPEDGN